MLRNGFDHLESYQIAKKTQFLDQFKRFIELGP